MAINQIYNRSSIVGCLYKIPILYSEDIGLVMVGRYLRQGFLGSSIYRRLRYRWNGNEQYDENGYHLGVASVSMYC